MIIFQNPGLIDLRGLRCFGINAKQNDDPIGFFGTGLKYAIAGLLRTGHLISLYRGLDCYEFGLKHDQMRGKKFEFIILTHPNGDVEELSFTTELGKNWEDWCFFRELHSNCLDEGGSTERIDSEGGYFPEKDKTAFLVTGVGIEQSYSKRDTIFLGGTPLFSNHDIEIFYGQNDFVYYRGIRVQKLNYPSLYTYNLKNLYWGLTEDRTLKDSHDLDYHVSKFIGFDAPIEYLVNILVAESKYAENHLINFCSVVSRAVSDTFLKIYETLRKNGCALTLTDLANGIYKSQNKALPLPDPISLSSIQQKQLDRALVFCQKADWRVTDYPILVVPHAHGGMLALAENGKIILTKECFDRGLKTVVAALYEEWTHLKFGFKDETREMQTHLFNQIINLSEQITGEPL